MKIPMSADQAMPPTASPAQDAPMDESEGELCVPLSFLAQPDDKEAMQTPAEGDVVTLSVDATVTRIEGDNAYIKPQSVNGNDLASDDENAEQPDEGAALRDESGQMNDEQT